MQNNDYLTLYYLANETKMKRTLPKWARDEQYDQIDEFCREMYSEKRKRRRQNQADSQGLEESSDGSRRKGILRGLFSW